MSSVRAMPSLRPTRWCRNSGSLTWSPIVCSGDSDTIGSWKIIEMWRPRIRRSAMPSGFSLVMSRGGLFEPGAANRILPDVMCAGLGQDAHHRLRGDGFARSGFADERDGRAGTDAGTRSDRARAPSCRDCRTRWKGPEPRSGLRKLLSPSGGRHLARPRGGTQTRSASDLPLQNARTRRRRRVPRGRAGCRSGRGRGGMPAPAARSP